MKGDSKKLKPFIIFASASREAKALDGEFKKHCRVVSSSNGCMKEELTLRYVNKILGWIVCVQCCRG